MATATPVSQYAVCPAPFTVAGRIALASASAISRGRASADQCTPNGTPTTVPTRTVAFIARRRSQPVRLVNGTTSVGVCTETGAFQSLNVSVPPEETSCSGYGVPSAATRRVDEPSGP